MFERYYNVASNGCWNSAMALMPSGYSLIKINGRMVLLHVFMWEQENGIKPYKMTLDHKCRNRKCCNPNHLELVTNAVNVRRGRSTTMTQEIVDKIRNGEYKGTQKEIAKTLGVSRHSIGDIVRRKRWR